MGSDDVYTFQTPELIIVGLEHPHRVRDLTPTHSLVGQNGQENPAFAESGGGDKFLRFIHQELIPEIDARYRTMPFRILMGHSTGGLLTLHDLVSDRKGFGAHIALDPSLWWDDRATLKAAEAKMKAGWNRRSLVYVAAANPTPVEGYDVDLHFDTIVAFTDLLENGPDGIVSKYDFFPDEEHDTVALPGFIKGLEFVFEGHRPDFYGFLAEPEAMVAQYEALSERLGVKIPPAEGMVDLLGGWAEATGAQENARTFRRINVANHQDSYHAVRALADLLEAEGDSVEAAEVVEDFLNRNPDYVGDQ